MLSLMDIDVDASQVQDGMSATLNDGKVGQGYHEDGFSGSRHVKTPTEWAV